MLKTFTLAAGLLAAAALFNLASAAPLTPSAAGPAAQGSVVVPAKVKTGTKVPMKGTKMKSVKGPKGMRHKGVRHGHMGRGHRHRGAGGAAAFGVGLELLGTILEMQGEDDD